jgi:hypothetical protein
MQTVSTRVWVLIDPKRCLRNFAQARKMKISATALPQAGLAGPICTIVPVRSLAPTRTPLFGWAYGLRARFAGQIPGSAANPNVAVRAQSPARTDPVTVPTAMPEATPAATHTYRTAATAAADMHPAATTTRMHPAAVTTTTAVTTTAVTAATMGSERKCRDEKARGNRSDQRRFTQHLKTPRFRGEKCHFGWHSAILHNDRNSEMVRNIARRELDAPAIL